MQLNKVKMGGKFFYGLGLVISLFGGVVFCDNVYSKCGGSLQCVEKEMIKFVDGLEEGGKNLSVLGGAVVFEKTGNFEQPRGEEGIIDRCVRFFADREVKIKMTGETARSLLDEARSSKLKKIVLPLLILLKLKAAIVIPAVLSAIALVAFKGLGASLIALAISGATALKSFLEGHSSSKFTYEVVPPIAGPHWSRAGVDPLAAQQYHTIP